MYALEKHLRENYSHNELADCARYGCQGGFGDFIYYSDTTRYFEQFKEDCFSIVNDYNEMTGEKGFPKYINDNMETYKTFANSMIWFAVEWIANEITQGEYIKESEGVLNSKGEKDYSIDSNGYYMGDNLTPEQEIHNLNLDNQI